MIMMVVMGDFREVNGCVVIVEKPIISQKSTIKARVTKI